MKEADLEIAEAISRFVTGPEAPMASTEPASLTLADFLAFKRTCLGTACGCCRGTGEMAGLSCFVCAGTGERQPEEE